MVFMRGRFIRGRRLVMGFLDMMFWYWGRGVLCVLFFERALLCE
jgi:hypothetical protein